MISTITSRMIKRAIAGAFVVASVVLLASCTTTSNDAGPPATSLAASPSHTSSGGSSTSGPGDTNGSTASSLSPSSPGSTGSPSPSSPDKRLQVTPEIVTSSYADDSITVSVIVPGLVDSGGTCTLTVVANGQTVAATRGGLADAASTSCGQITIASPSLGATSATAQVAYDSPMAHGVSVTITMERT